MKTESMIGVKSAFVISTFLHGALVAGGMFLSLGDDSIVPLEKTMFVEIVADERPRAMAIEQGPRPITPLLEDSVAKAGQVLETVAPQDLSINMPDPVMLPHSLPKTTDVGGRPTVEPPREAEIDIAATTPSDPKPPGKIASENPLLSPPKLRNRPNRALRKAPNVFKMPNEPLKTDVAPKKDIGASEQLESEEIVRPSNTVKVNNAPKSVDRPIQVARLADKEVSTWSPAIGNKKPKYPGLARRHGLEGRVLLLVHVDEQGQVISSETKQSSGHLILDNAANKAVKSWRFVASQQAMRITRMTVEIPIVFKLTK
jgi:protein TonB